MNGEIEVKNMTPEVDRTAAKIAAPEAYPRSPNSTSPSPNLVPTPASSCFSSERSFSGVSTISTLSSHSSIVSSGTRSSSFSTTRRRGYIRPQGAVFAPSAKNRESVMCLGSIAHLQYYFARTGLLDGKGGQLAKTKENGEYDIPRLSLSGSDVVESPVEEEGQLLWEAAKDEGEEILLPPTVSTYSERVQPLSPPPDQKTLKKDLVNALENALQALESCEQKDSASLEAPTEGFYEIQGLHILDTTTLAIRAARLYYTMHPNSARLNQIKPDQQSRQELYAVLDVLKKCAGRNFAGGIREEERLSILVWVSEVGLMIDQETRLEEQERRERENWHWMDDTRWTGRDTEREMSFIHFLVKDLTASTSPDVQKTAAGSPDQKASLKDLADGRKLVQMHNQAVETSKKRFGQIPTFHEDVAKPYRRADNIRFWLKAAELRWEVKLKFDVMALANAGIDCDDDAPVWSAFEQVLLEWSKCVRTELARDWSVDDEVAGKIHARAKSLASLSANPQKPTSSSSSETIAV